MSQCYECAFYANFERECLCPAKKVAYGRPLYDYIRTSGEAPACDFFVDIDEVM